jgi:hypothetical protein
MTHRVARLFWIELPSAAGRRWPLLRTVLSDGWYLLAWPRTAALAPVGAVVLGFGLGAFRPISEAIFTFSVFWPILLVIPAAFGAGLGAWAWIGFVFGDFFLFPHLFFRTSVAEHFLTERVPLLISYEVLLGLMVLLPLAAVALPATITRPLAGRVPSRALLTARIVLAALVAGLTATSWSASVQVLLHPIALLGGGVQSPTAVQALRNGGIALIWLAAGLTALRALLQPLLERLAVRGWPEAVPGPEQEPRKDWLRQLVGSLASAAFVTLALLALVEEPWQLLLLFAALFASAVLRRILLPRMPGFSVAMNRIPLLLRIVIIGAIGYAIGEVVLTVMSDYPPGLGLSYVPMLIAAVLSILAASLLLPGPPIQAAGRTSQ